MAPDWVTLLPIAEFSYNNATQTSIGCSPFFAMYALHPQALPAIPVPMEEEITLDGWHKQIWQVRDLAQTQLREQKEAMKNRFDEKHPHRPLYQIGERVWLSTRYLPKKGIGTKLGPRFMGPFVVKESINQVTYKLILPATWKVHPVFHISQLKKFIPSEIPNREVPKPPPIQMGSEEEYEVERIVDSRWNRNQLQYLVHWKGYSIAERTWEPVRHLHAPQAVAEFHRRHPDKPGGRKRRESHTVTSQDVQAELDEPEPSTSAFPAGSDVQQDPSQGTQEVSHNQRYPHEPPTSMLRRSRRLNHQVNPIPRWRPAALYFPRRSYVRASAARRLKTAQLQRISASQ